jgi:flavodoxin
VRGLIVYFSRWGSCKKIAEAIGRGLNESGQDVGIIAVQEAGEPDPSLDFILVGGATKWPGATGNIKRYAKSVAAAGFSGKPFATFSTGGYASGEKSNTQASEVLYELLERGGLKPLAPPFKAAIEGYKPPGATKKMRGLLPESEVARAEDFGRELADKLSA